MRITHEGRAPVVADTCTGIFYNPNTPYVAEQLLDDQPERTIFIVPDDQTLRACLSEIDERVADDPSRPLRFDHAPIDAGTFIQLRRLVELLDRDSQQHDSVAAQEMLIQIVGQLIAQSYRARGHATQPRVSERTIRRHREIARNAREMCLRHFDESIGLEDLADAVGTSRFHLCRVFRTFNGRSIHQYLTELRLRASLEGVCDRRAPLAQVALSAGFGSQSHFTTTFVRRFHRTPAAFRREVLRGRIRV